jgi:hypothetical protein
MMCAHGSAAFDSEPGALALRLDRQVLVEIGASVSAAMTVASRGVRPSSRTRIRPVRPSSSICAVEKISPHA